MNFYLEGGGLPKAAHNIFIYMFIRIQPASISIAKTMAIAGMILFELFKAIFNFSKVFSSINCSCNHFHICTIAIARDIYVFISSAYKHN